MLSLPSPGMPCHPIPLVPLATRAISESRLTLVIGPNSSGKSARAERLVHDLHASEPSGALIYVATMVPADDVGRTKVAAHRRARSGSGFITVASPTGDIERTHPDFIEPDDLILLEDVSNLLSNLIFASSLGDNEYSAAEACAHDRIAHLCDLSRHVVAVTIGGLEVSPDFDAPTNDYILALNRLNARLSAEADQVLTQGGDA